MPVYADMVKANTCYLCSPSIPPNPVNDEAAETEHKPF